MQPVLRRAFSTLRILALALAVVLTPAAFAQAAGHGGGGGGFHGNGMGHHIHGGGVWGYPYYYGVGGYPYDTSGFYTAFGFGAVPYPPNYYGPCNFYQQLDNSVSNFYQQFSP
jgi:hypothetical protein